MTLKSVKKIYSIGDLVGFLSSDETSVDDLGIVVAESNSRLKIIWDDGFQSIPFNSKQKADSWINFGKSSDKLRLIITLKYMS